MYPEVASVKSFLMNKRNNILLRYYDTNLKKCISITFVVLIAVLNLSFESSSHRNMTPLNRASLISDSISLSVRKCTDFEITGSGNSEKWKNTNWVLLNKINKKGHNYQSKFKIMYSEEGIYLLFSGEDNKLTTKDYEDMDHLWFHDVFEAFFHPDPKKSTYFEFQVNPFGKQLLLTISKLNNGVSWIPFNQSNRDYYETYSKTKVIRDAAKDKTISSWTAEVFISYKSLGLLPKIPPKSGDVWKANFYRLDYDTGEMGKWSWSPTIEESFHELNHFGFIRFE